jgi:hypothetical protein
MARSIDKKCLACSSLTIEEAILLHSESGDGCWNPKICHSRRSHYKKRSENNYKRRIRRRNNKFEQIEVSQPTVYSAVLVLYRSRKDSPVHAVAVRVWQGNKQVAEVPTVHCVGLNGKQLRDFLGGVLTTLKQKYDINRFEEKILELKPEQCPILPCPLKFLES